ncbi:MAG: 2-oxoadipate dioxygenase/decarboxylase [Segniliparus sp.]|uniref:2-oxoadipate dioxygenase/decarboxylase n=1 Tax=Segniliparus sp. TaxID=2804064 RepID=UPI003F32958F
MIEPHALRARFAERLSAHYGVEVPAYTTLVDVVDEVNRDWWSERGASPGAEALGGAGRVGAERHGAIRVGTPAELAQAARIFAGFGMFPVGFYDLRDARPVPVPVVSTAFRPIDPAELERNPFRVFTSMLATRDPAFFDSGLRPRLEAFLARRQLFPPRLLELADRAADERGLPEERAEEFVTLAAKAFALGSEPIDGPWYRELESISAVAADIGGIGSTHINHLTPRVLDIDELYRRLAARGLKMIDEIQGPPRWDGPDVLLRQTSFRALDEPRTFREADGTVRPGSLRVRFGEVEARGIALTEAGRDRYDQALAAADRLRAAESLTGQEAAARVWPEFFPATEAELAELGLGFFTYRVENGAARAVPIVYEDFLPRSAAGIFQSNLDEEASAPSLPPEADYNQDWLSGAIGRDILDPYELYRAQERASREAVAAELGPAHPFTTGASTTGADQIGAAI